MVWVQMGLKLWNLLAFFINDSSLPTLKDSVILLPSTKKVLYYFEENIHENPHKNAKESNILFSMNNMMFIFPLPKKRGSHLILSGVKKETLLEIVAGSDKSRASSAQSNILGLWRAPLHRRNPQVSVRLYDTDPTMVSMGSHENFWFEQSW